MFGKLKEFARQSPALAGLLRELIGYLLFGGSETAKKNLLTGWQALDTDGDGIPDFLEEAKERLSARTQPEIHGVRTLEVVLDEEENTASDRMTVDAVQARDQFIVDQCIVADLRKRGLADEVIRKLGYQI